MFEALLLILFIGFIISLHPRLGRANPYQIYFLVWLLVTFGYYVTNDIFIRIDNTYVFLILISHYFALSLLVISFFRNKSEPIYVSNVVSTIGINKLVFYFLLFLTVAGVMPTLNLANQIAGGDSVFTILGFMKLRNAITYEGKGFGVFAYLTPLALVLASVSLIAWKNNKVYFLYFLISLLAALFYCYISTGRTFIVVLFCFMAVPFYASGLIKNKSLFVFSFLFMCLFLFIAGMTGKGVSFDNTFSQNVQTFKENIVGYSTAPFVAMSQLFVNFDRPEYGENSLRFFYAILNSMGLVDVKAVDLIKPYVNTPFQTNVYTVYEVYFRDFLYFGFLVPPMFLIFHGFLYSKSMVCGGRWVLFYAASTNPLLMSFFQDQYLSMLSFWIQVVFWISILCNNQKNRAGI